MENMDTRTKFLSTAGWQMVSIYNDSLLICIYMNSVYVHVI